MIVGDGSTSDGLLLKIIYYDNSEQYYYQTKMYDYDIIPIHHEIFIDVLLFLFFYFFSIFFISL
jgi:hypothetical protein